LLDPSNFFSQESDNLFVSVYRMIDIAKASLFKSWKGTDW